MMDTARVPWKAELFCDLMKSSNDRYVHSGHGQLTTSHALSSVPFLSLHAQDLWLGELSSELNSEPMDGSF